jgi:Ni,Fe-hydrogenase III small subunit
MRLLSRILRTGLVTEPLPLDDLEAVTVARRIEVRSRDLFGRSLGIRQVDAGSCNGCELEIGGLTGPVYDLERFGLRFVASPRHADMLLVTGPVTRNMAVALRKTWEATPDPKLVVAVGDCGKDCGVFAGSYAIVGGVEAVIPVDAYIAGCPPAPADILRGVLAALDMTHDRRTRVLAARGRRPLS